MKRWIFNIIAASSALCFLYVSSGFMNVIFGEPLPTVNPKGDVNPFPPIELIDYVYVATINSLFAILPAIWFIKWRKRSKLGPNACPSCSYDLTGNTTGECPECGVKTEGSASELA